MSAETGQWRERSTYSHHQGNDKLMALSEMSQSKHILTEAGVLQICVYTVLPSALL